MNLVKTTILVSLLANSILCLDINSLSGMTESFGALKSLWQVSKRLQSLGKCNGVIACVQAKTFTTPVCAADNNVKKIFAGACHMMMHNCLFKTKFNQLKSLTECPRVSVGYLGFQICRKSKSSCKIVGHKLQLRKSGIRGFNFNDEVFTDEFESNIAGISSYDLSDMTPMLDR